MKQGSENKSHIVHRIIISTRKSQPEHEKSRSKSPVRKFQYQIPSSFFRAVDKARLEAGYDILPRFHNPSSSSHRTASLSSLALDRSKTPHFTKHNDFHSSSIVDVDKASSKQVRFHHKFHKQSDSDHHHHHHHHRHHHRRRHRKTSEQTASNSSLLQLTRSISSHRQSAIPRATSSTRSKHS